MAIYRGIGGSVEGISESEILVVAVNQGGTGARTAALARENLGLGSAATTSTVDYATAVQGAKADTAVQPEDLGTVATSNSYNDLDDKPALGTAALTDSTDYATAAQGALADSAIQAGDLATVATTGAYSDLTGKPTLATVATTGAYNDLIGKPSLATVATSGSYTDLSNKPSLATVATSGSYTDLSNKPTIPSNIDDLSDVVITTPSTSQVLQYNGTNWVNATVGGAGTVTSVDMTVPTGLAVSGNPITSSGTLAVTYASGYAIPTTAKQTEWDTAYTDRNKWDGGSTGLNAATGRTSLGLGTAATTASTDYATAAQGTKADNALTAANPSFTGNMTGTGDIRLNNGNADGAQLQLASSGYSDWNIDNYSGRLRAYYGSTEYFTVDSSGNVGIGTSSPSTYGAKLVVAAQNGIAIAGYQPLQSWIDTNDANKGVRISTAGGVMGFQNDNTGGGSYTERMRIDSSGNVGIGTSSPAQKLHVSGGTRLDGNVESNSSAYVYSWAGGSSGQVRSGIYLDGTNSILSFFAGQAERARIDSSGNFQFNSGYGSVETAYGCRAWVRFNGTNANGTNSTIFGSGGITSIAKTASGVFTANFSFTMPDGNYSAVGTVQDTDTNANAVVCMRSDSTYGTTSLSNIMTFVPGTGVLSSPTSVSLLFFR